MEKVCFGIDLGTSSSSISYLADSPRAAKDSFVEPTAIQFSPPPGGSPSQNWQRLPSVVHVEKKGGKTRVVTGFEAAEAAAGRVARPFVDLFMSVKSDMGTLRVYEDSVHPNLLTPVDVSAEIIGELIRAAEKAAGVSPKNSPVVITVPASFTHSQRQDTLRAARKAGLTIDEGALLDEPIAAFIHSACHQQVDIRLDLAAPKNILVFDLGAGTCDVSVFYASYKHDPSGPGIGLNIVNRAIGNYMKLGGDNIDLAIVRKEVLPVFCDRNSLDFDSLPEKVKRELRFRLKLKAREIKEGICRQMIHDWGKKRIGQRWSIDAFPIPDLGLRMKKTGDVTNLEGFLEIMKPFVSDDLKASLKIWDDYRAASFFGPVFETINEAGLKPEEIDGFIFNGGSCHSPVIRKAFENHGSFPRAAFFTAPDLDLSVSKGAAIHCYHLYRNNRALVKPILNTSIGLYTLGLKKEQLAAAGTPLPYPPEGSAVIQDRFFVPHDGAAEVIFSVYTGGGGVTSSLKLPMPQGVRKGEPIGIGLSIDANKVLHFEAFLQNTPGARIQAELSNPWTHRVVKPEDKAANDLWQQVSELKRQGREVPTDTIFSLAAKERLRGNADISLEILQRLQDKGHDSAELQNLFALCYDDHRLPEKALEHFRKAAELEPENVLYVANYGSELLEHGRVEEAICRLREAVNLSPDYHFAFRWLGNAYRKQGDEEAARREYQRAGQILKQCCIQTPDSEHCLKGLKDVHLALGQYEEADRVGLQLQDLRNRKLLGGSTEDLVAGPSSGLWKEEEIFEAEGRD